MSKAPDDMFPEIEIDNDLLMVDDIIRSYYGIENPKTERKSRRNSNDYKTTGI